MDKTSLHFIQSLVNIEEPTTSSPENSVVVALD